MIGRKPMALCRSRYKMAAWFGISPTPFLGFVNSDKSRPESQPFINNSMIVQDSGALVQTLHGGTAQSPTSLIIPVDQNAWYWVSDMTVEGDRLRVFVMEFIRIGSGPFQ
jgi:hypothetical protein